MVMRAAVGILSVAAFVVASAAPTTRVAEAQPAPQWGWYVAINTAKTESASISFTAGPSQESQGKWTHTWKRGEPETFWVGGTGAQSPQLYLNAAVGERGKNGWFCLMYVDSQAQRKGVKHWDFDNTEHRTVKNTDRDNECGG